MRDARKKWNATNVTRSIRTLLIELFASYRIWDPLVTYLTATYQHH
ncbi:MAG TPA: hypothetical protein VKQ30_18970 [Ktedonobacterales bacterium]|nr:hypothetical protein [Ktedonobacterales bacterium]